jgi:hypothetical protein
MTYLQRTETHVPTSKSKQLSNEQLTEVLSLMKGADSVELKLTVPDSNRRSTVQALGIDALEAQVRQVVFFDTPTLDLDRQGVVVRARRVQGEPGDSVVKLRPVIPASLPADLRRKKGFGVEIDAMPGGFVCSGRLKEEVDSQEIREVVAGKRKLHKLFTKTQRALFEQHTSGEVDLDELSVLGPIFVLKVKFSPKGYDRKLVTELWIYPDGSRILELSTKCLPSDTFDVAAETKAFLSSRGVDLDADQQTKTRTALQFFSSELAATGRV